MNKLYIIVMLCTLISKMLGFLREVFLSYNYGASSITDAYIISTSIPLIFFSLVGVGITTGYIPMYLKKVNESGEVKGKEYTLCMINFIILVSIIFIFIVIIFTERIVKLFALGFDRETFELTVFFTKISIVGIIFSGITYVLISYLQANGKFKASSLVGVPLNISIIISLFLGKINLIFLPLGIVVGNFLQVLFLTLLIKKKNPKYKFQINFIDLKSTLKIAIPAVLGVSITQINGIVDKAIGSTLGTGAISSLSYSNKLIALIVGIFIAPIITVLYPKFSLLAVNKEYSSLKKIFSKSIKLMFLLVIPFMLILIFFSKDIINFIFGRGALKENDLIITSEVLYYFSMGIIFLGLREITTRVFFSLGDTKTPIFNTSIAVITNVFFSIFLSQLMGLKGIALATSISAFLSTLLLLRKLKKKYNIFIEKMDIVIIVKSIIISIIITVVAKYLYMMISFSIYKEILLIITLLSIILIYSLFIIKIKFIEIENLIKLKRRKNV